MTRPAILNEPDKWVAVPVEPVREQWAAMADTLYRYKNRHHDKVAGDLFEAMLAARPDPTALADLVAYAEGLEGDRDRIEALLSDFLPPHVEWKERDVDSVLVHHKISLINDARRYLRDRSSKVKTLAGRAETAEARVIELERRLADAEKVIEPLAAAAAFYDSPGGGDGNVAWAHDFTLGHLRAARKWKEGK
jgi:hypothetical protein